MRALLSLVVVVVLAGCVSVGSVSSPVPVETGGGLSFFCTPEGGGTASPCSQAEYEAQVERDRLYVEAETVYRKLSAAEDVLYRQGAPADDSVLQYVVGVAKEVTTEAHANGLKVIGGETEILRVSRLVGDSKENSDLALAICIDYSATTLVLADGSQSEGIVADERAYFVVIDGSPRIVFLDYKKVESC